MILLWSNASQRLAGLPNDNSCFFKITVDVTFEIRKEKTKMKEKKEKNDKKA